MTNETTNHVETSAKVNTRLTKDGDKHVTELKLIWDVDTETLIKLAQQSVIIKLQSNYRAAEKVPKTDEQKVSDLIRNNGRTKKVLTPKEILERAKDNPEFKEELLKLLKESE